MTNRYCAALIALVFVVVMQPPLMAQQAVAASSPLPGVRLTSSQAERLIEIIQRQPTSSPEAPHIDWVSLQEERVGGRVFIVQRIGYHALKGNANNLHFQLISVSRPDAHVRLRDHPISAPSLRQQRGTFIAARFICGRFEKSYSHVKQATIFDANGERSNTVEFTVDCNLALTS